MEKEQTITIPLTKIIHGITTIYMLMITVLLPLYHRDGFCYIGDRKYRLFFISSIILIPIILLLLGIKKLAFKEKVTVSVTDICAIGYAGVVTFSCFMSSYRAVAIWGYEDWHMGTITQLLFIGIYFVVSRGWNGQIAIVKAICATSGLIFLIGVLNRFALDPLRMFEGLEYWNKTHLLSTIGNINWYSAYACVVFPLGLYFFWSYPVKTAKWSKQIIMLLYCCVTFATLVTQGSESGLVTLAAVLVTFSYFSLESIEHMERFLQINIILGITVCLLGIVYRFCDKNQIYFAADLAMDKILLHPMWWGYTGMMILMLMWYHHKPFVLNTEKYQRIWRYSLIGSLLIIGSGVILHTWNVYFLPILHEIPIFYINNDWGSGRGFLWRVVCKAYLEMPWYNQLFGVGADCFGPYLYAHYAQSLEGFLAEWWGNAIVANAHNEWLNVLINSGIFGMVTYVSIFLTAIYRWRSKWKSERILIGLAICVMGYMVNNTVSFQQVVSTPIVFVIVGMGEYLYRKNASN